MPTKLNKAGNQQNYVPAGNGDASGEYGDNATGSNKHFKVFSKENENIAQQQTPIQLMVETSEKIRKNNEDFAKLRNATENKEIYVRYHNGQLSILTQEQWDNRTYRTYEDFASYFKVRDIIDMNEEQRKEFVKLAIEDAEICLDLPSYNDEESLLSLIPDSFEGKSRLIREMMFGPYHDEDSFVVQSIFSSMYEKELKEIGEKITERVNKKRASLGKEYIDNNLAKVNDGFSIEDALKKANPNYNNGDESYRTNCQRCSFAYELLRRGYDVQAQENTDNFGSKRKWLCQMCWKEQYNITAPTYNGAKKQIDEIIKKAGNGARFCLAVRWKGGSGHAFIGENVNGEVKYFDAQNGSSNCESYFNRIQSKSPIFLGRMDNADFSESIKLGVRSE